MQRVKPDSKDPSRYSFPRGKQFAQVLQERALILDGAMGTMIQRHKLEEEDYRGERFADWSSDLKGNNDLLVLTQPEIIKNIHCQYLEAGADILETNTFNATSISMADYDMQELVREINIEAARLAKEAADEFTAKNPQKPRFVAGVLGRQTEPHRFLQMLTTLACVISVLMTW